MTLPLTYRLKCKLSYCDEETGELRCRAVGVCDGTAYFDPCQPERCVYDDSCLCCWPIDECADCPNHPGNYEPYWGMTRAVIM